MTDSRSRRQDAARLRLQQVEIKALRARVRALSGAAKAARRALSHLIATGERKAFVTALRKLDSVLGPPR